MIINNEKDFDRFFFEAEKYRQAGQLREAVEIFFGLLEYRLQQRKLGKAIQFSNYDAIIIERISDLSQLFGWKQTALDMLEGLSQLYRQHQQSYLAFQTQLKKAHLLISLSRGEEAFELVNDVFSPYLGSLNDILFREDRLIEWENNTQLPMLNKVEKTFFFAYFYFLLGSLLSYFGQYREALDCFNRGEGHCEAYPEELQQLRTLHILEKARAQIEIGDLEEGKKQVNQLKQTSDDFTITSGIGVNVLELWSKVHMMQGDFSTAVEALHQIIKMANEYGLSHTLIISYTNIAQAKILLNQVTEAEEYLDEAAQLADANEYSGQKGRIELLRLLSHLRSQSSMGPINLSPSSSNFSTGNRQKNTPPSITEQHQQQNAHYLTWFEDRALAFQLLLANRDYLQAGNFLEEIKAVFHATDSLLIHCRLEILDILLKYYQQLAIDQEKVWQIIHYLKAEQLLPELWQFQRIITWMDWLPVNEKEQLIQENQALLEKITASLPKENQAIYLLNKWSGEERFIAAQIEAFVHSKLKSLKNIFTRPWFYWSYLKRLNRLLAFLDRNKDVNAISVVSGTKDALNKGSDKIISAVKRMIQHPRDTLTISFLILPDRIVIFYYSFLKIGFEITLTGRIYVRKTIREIYQAIDGLDLTRAGRVKTAEARVKDFEEKVSQLSEALQLEKILSKVPSRIKTIRFIPEDSLHGMPFSLIKVKGEYLIQKFAVTVGYENILATRARQHLKFKDSGALLVGVSNAPGFNPLPGVKTEVPVIQSFLSGENSPTTILQDDEANRANILKGLKGKKLLHIACHGFFQHDEPDKTGLILGRGETLSLRDILETEQFDELEHVTLSSCFGADHFSLPGRWVISLPETLWRSGVGTVLGCLWEVSDQFAIPFMKRFYEYAETHPRSVALQKTQIDALEHKLELEINEHSSLPFYWSGFQIYG